MHPFLVLVGVGGERGGIADPRLRFPTELGLGPQDERGTLGDQERLTRKNERLDRSRLGPARCRTDQAEAGQQQEQATGGSRWQAAWHAMRPGGGGQSQRNQERTNEPALRSAMIANRTGWQPTRHQQQCDAPRQHAGPGDLPRPARSRAEVGPRDALHGAGAHGPDTARVCPPDRPHSLTPVRWRGASDLKAPSLISQTQSPLMATFEELGRRASSQGIDQFLSQLAPQRHASLAVVGPQAGSA